MLLLFNITEYEHIKEWFKHFVILLSCKKRSPLFLHSFKYFSDTILLEKQQFFEPNNITPVTPKLGDDGTGEEDMYKKKADSAFLKEFSELADEVKILQLEQCDPNTSPNE